VIRVIGAVPCEGTLLERDPWIPLKVSWLPAIHRRPLYLRISGYNGGEIECKVDPTSGLLMQVILLLLPTSITNTSRLCMISAEDDVLAPLFDSSMWKDMTNGLSENAAAGSIEKLNATIRLENASNGMRISINDSDPVSFVRAGNAEIGYTADGQLSSLTAIFDAETPLSASAAEQDAVAEVSAEMWERPRSLCGAA